MPSGEALLTRYRLRSVRIALLTTFPVVAAMAIAPLLPNWGATSPAAWTAIIVIALAGALGVWALPWPRLAAAGYVLHVFYAWSVADILLITAAIMVAPQWTAEIFSIYALTTIFFAASYPKTAQVLLLLFTVGAFLGGLALNGGPWHAGALTLMLTSLFGVAFMASFLARELRRQMDDHLRATTRFQSLVQNASDAITVTDRDGVISYQSPSVRTILGREPSDLVGTHIDDLIDPEDLPRVQALLDSRLREGPVTFETRARARDGSFRDLEVIATVVRGDPGLTGTVFNARDVTDRQRLVAELERQALYDGLTGLANRTLFLDRLAMTSVRRPHERRASAVMLLDLDRFKVVNESAGPATGDALLVTIAERLRAIATTHDTVSRLGADEFALLIEDREGAGDIDQLAARILDTVEEPLDLPDRQIHVSASIGIVLLDAAPPDAEDLLRRAETAMYAAKSGGRARVRYFDEEHHASTRRDADLALDMPGALAREEFRLVFQRLERLGRGAITGAEALLRWDHPRFGVISPDQFIPLAESTGLIGRLGDWVLSIACQQTARWLADGFPPDFVVSVNVSSVQITQPDFVRRTLEIVQRSGVAPRHVLLEVTENVWIDDFAGVSGQLEALRRHGFRIAIDDFGSGYSSLQYLDRLPVDILKIDRAFIPQLSSDDPSTTLLASIVEMSRRRRLLTIAEGLETEDQVEAVTLLGCDWGQGFQIGRPVAAKEFPHDPPPLAAA